ncbi:MAG TPA: group III truncated hemoglobin [Chitinophagaceae bacterium]|nr:group III truncated hemoglobin [Chitinophagaceae bacterium]
MDKHDIQSADDIQTFIDDFYARVRRDELLAPVFRQRIPTDEDWPHHLQVIHNFWNSVLFAVPAYKGNPFPKHVGLGIESRHFDRWIALFHQTIDDHFSGPKADEVKQKAVKMRQLFEIKLDSGADGFRSLV